MADTHSILAQLLSVYDAIACLDGEETGAPHVADALTRHCRRAKELQRKLLASGYQTPDAWLIVPGGVTIGQPDARGHCRAHIAADPSLDAIRKQLRAAILRAEVEADRPDAAAKSPPSEKQPAKSEPRRVTTNDLMILALEKNPEAANWSITQWEAHTGRGRATIHACEQWKQLAAAHKLAEVERRLRQDKLRGLNKRGIDRRRQGRNID